MQKTQESHDKLLEAFNTIAGMAFSTTNGLSKWERADLNGCLLYLTNALDSLEQRLKPKEDER